MQPALEPLDRLIEQTVRRLENEHGIGRVSVIIESAARRVGCHFNLARALFNLLDNALHASPPGQMVQLFATRVAPGQLRIEIRDQGVGIPPELSSRVFDVNFTTRKQEGGSGIGLTVVREILLGLGGRVELSGQASGGTVATVHLPFRAT
jgi:polar amino acid transport system substrate-binding protein